MGRGNVVFFDGHVSTEDNRSPYTFEDVTDCHWIIR